jgi:hypothetical protein
LPRPAFCPSYITILSNRLNYMNLPVGTLFALISRKRRPKGDDDERFLRYGLGCLISAAASIGPAMADVIFTDSTFNLANYTATAPFSNNGSASHIQLKPKRHFSRGDPYQMAYCVVPGSSISSCGSTFEA